ncbi:MAG: ligand-binding sensor domain-containing protein [Patiriisocius sp.]|jgi:ligand-binding sensor domain-containing protein
MKQTILTFTFLISIILNAQTFTSWTVDDGMPSNSCNDVSVDAAGNVWVATSGGVGVFDGTSWLNYNDADGLVDNNVSSILVASDGRVWMGTSFGISVLDGSSWTTYTEDDGIADDQIRCINEDADGIIWFGTGNGASSFDGTTWTNLGSAEGLPFGGVNDILQDDNMLMNFATGLSGVATQASNGAISLIDEDSGLVNERMTALALAPNGNLWAASSEGINVLSGNTIVGQHTTLFILPPPDTLNPVEDVIFDLNGYVWSSVYVDYLVTVGGVSVYNGTSWEQFDVSDGLAGPVVRRLAVDQNNDVWVTTSTGITRISGYAPLSLNEISLQNLILYPNPTEGRFAIEIPSDIEEYNVQVYDGLGRLVLQENIADHGIHEMSIGHLVKGTYFVTMTSENSIHQEVVILN